MKIKNYVIGLLSLAALGAGVQQAAAFFGRDCCCNKYCTTICCRPYNAFTPVCFGSIVCDGCCPLQSCTPPSYCGAPRCWSPASCTPSYCSPAFMAPTFLPPGCPGGYCGAGYPPPFPFAAPPP